MLKFKSSRINHESTGKTSGVLTIPRQIWNGWLDAGFDTVDLYFEDYKLIIIPRKGTK
ncbi:MAG TPA: hypothetical protein PLA21_06535 [Rectinema sp.]|nr:hypothetical protein [Rectinema sp.]